MLAVGDQIGPFTIEKEIGNGAMGTVYRALFAQRKMHVALKVMAPGLSSETALKRFKREADILKQLKHPNIVRLVGIGKHHKNPYYAMEFIEGESLDHVMARRGRISWEDVVTLGKQLCAGLQHAHEHGIIHRDLKPSNLMLTPDGTIKLTDFGIAKDLDVTQLTAANCTVGTASYMSPEQCRGERELTHKSDLYSLGVMFYELLLGRKPFQAETIMEMFRLHNEGTFKRPAQKVLDIPIWLDTLVCQLLEKKPEKRPLDAATVGQALERVKEKVEAQQSAGIEAATARKIDRSDLQPRLDETDKEAARTLLKRRKKKKVVPFYRKVWFQGVALSALLVSVAFVFYLVFIKAPSPESLLQQAEKLLLTDRREARKGPITDFLSYHPDHPHAPKFRAWADEIDRDELEQSLLKRMNSGWSAESDAENLFRQATKQERNGKIKDADKTWNELRPYSNPDDADAPKYRQVAAKHLQEFKDADVLFNELEKKAKAAADKTDKEQTKSESEDEKKALEAVRAELAEEFEKAKNYWNALKTDIQPESDRRRWYLLAAKRAEKLDEAPKSKK